MSVGTQRGGHSHKTRGGPLLSAQRPQLYVLALVATGQSRAQDGHTATKNIHIQADRTSTLSDQTHTRRQTTSLKHCRPTRWHHPHRSHLVSRATLAHNMSFSNPTPDTRGASARNHTASCSRGLVILSACHLQSSQGGVRRRPSSPHLRTSRPSNLCLCLCPCSIAEAPLSNPAILRASRTLSRVEPQLRLHPAR